MDEKTARGKRQAELDGKVMAAKEADTELASIATSLERLAGWQGQRFMTDGGDGDSDGTIVGITKKQFREAVGKALAEVVTALGAVRVVKAHRANIANQVRNMTDEEFDQ